MAKLGNVYIFALHTVALSALGAAAGLLMCLGLYAAAELGVWFLLDGCRWDASGTFLTSNTLFWVTRDSAAAGGGWESHLNSNLYLYWATLGSLVAVAHWVAPLLKSDKGRLFADELFFWEGMGFWLVAGHTTSLILGAMAGGMATVLTMPLSFLFGVRLHPFLGLALAGLFYFTTLAKTFREFVFPGKNVDKYKGCGECDYCRPHPYPYTPAYFPPPPPPSWDPAKPCVVRERVRERELGPYRPWRNHWE